MFTETTVYTATAADIVNEHPVTILRTADLWIVRDLEEPWRVYIFAGIFQIAGDTRWVQVANPRMADLASDFAKFLVNAISEL